MINKTALALFILLAFFPVYAAASEHSLVVQLNDGKKIRETILSEESIRRLPIVTVKVFDPWLGYRQYRAVSIESLVPVPAGHVIRKIEVFDKSGGKIELAASSEKGSQMLLAYGEDEENLPACHGGPYKMIYSPPDRFAADYWQWYVIKVVYEID